MQVRQTTMKRIADATITALVIVGLLSAPFLPRTYAAPHQTTCETVYDFSTSDHGFEINPNETGGGYYDPGMGILASYDGTTYLSADITGDFRDDLTVYAVRFEFYADAPTSSTVALGWYRSYFWELTGLTAFPWYPPSGTPDTEVTPGTYTVNQTYSPASEPVMGSLSFTLRQPFAGDPDAGLWITEIGITTDCETPAEIITICEYTYDFTANDYDFNLIGDPIYPLLGNTSGEYVEGVGWQTEVYDDQQFFNYLTINKHFSEPVDIRNISFITQNDEDVSTLELWIIDLTEEGYLGDTIYNPTETAAYWASFAYEFHAGFFEFEGDGFGLRIFGAGVEDSAETSSRLTTISIDYDCLSPPDDAVSLYKKPVASEYIDHVYSPPIPACEGDCPSYDETIYTTHPGVGVQTPISGTVSYADNEVVLITNETDTILLSSLTDVNVQAGDLVSAGCTVGFAGDDKEVELTWIRDSAQIQYGTWGAYNDYDSIVFCGSRFSTANCINNNPNLDDHLNGWSWTGSNPATYNGIANLSNSTSIYQDIIIPEPAEEYTVTIAAKPLTNSEQRVRVSLGGGSTTSTHNGLYNLTVVSTVSPLVPGDPQVSPDIYRLLVTGLGPPGSEIQVDFICVHDAEATDITPPPLCYFPDPSFDDPSQWTAASGATKYGPNSFVRIPEDGTITAPVMIPEADDYNIEFFARLSPTPGSGELVTSLPATLNVDIDGNNVGDIQVSNYLSWFQYGLNFDVEDEGGWDGILTLETTAAEGSERIELDSICITPGSGSWSDPTGSGTPDPTDYTPSGGGAGGGIGGGLGFDPTCEFLSPPLSLDLIEWLYYGFNLLYKAIVCHLFGLISTGIQWIISVINGLGYLGRWIGALLLEFSKWGFNLFKAGINALLTGLASLFSAAINALATIPAIGNLFDFTKLFTFVVWGLVSWLLDLLTLFLQAIKAIGALITIILRMWGVFIAAINSSDTVTIDMPNCGSTSDPLYEMCQGLDMFDYAMAASPQLMIAVSALMAGIGIYMLFWTMRVVGNALSEV